jgi:hypothetical protein
MAVVTELGTGFWPVGEDERESLFRRLSFKSGIRVELGRYASTSEMFKLSTELPGELSAAWHAYHGKFMGVFFSPYSFIDPDVPAARRGHDEIWHKLKNFYSQPTRPWDNEEVPPSIWKVNGRDIVMHYFNSLHSGVLLSITDTALSDAAEAEVHNDWAKRSGETK